MDSSSSSSTSKRARAPTVGNQVASCLVDGCKSDLSKSRDYHRRHKVCELHSKTPRVTIGGREQRFCQQCSRFHSLGEFDEGKRSCRKRLEGHNRRRRKAQPDSVAVKPGNFLSSGRGGGSRFMAFSGSSPTMNIIPASSVSVSVSASVVNSGLYRQSHDVVLGGGGGASSYNSPRQFPFLQGQGQASSSTSATSNNLNLNLNHLNLTHHHHHHLSSALSLLSSETPEIGLTHIGIDMVQQQQPSFIHYNSNHHPSSDMMPISSTTLHQDVFQDGSCSATGPQQTLSFLWE